MNRTIYDLTQPAVIIDTETTNLDGEIIELGVIDAATGDVLINTLVYSNQPIAKEAFELHGITREQVDQAPKWSEIEPLFRQAVEGKAIYIFNREFDLGMLVKAFGGALPDYINAKHCHCVMNDYAEYHGEWHKKRQYDKRQSLIKATKQMDIDVSDLTTHRAVGDCEATRRLMHAYFPLQPMSLLVTENKRFEMVFSVTEVTGPQYLKAIQLLCDLALNHCTHGSAVAAQVLLSAYNSHYFQLNIVDLRYLDLTHQKAAFEVLKGRVQLNIEPQELIFNGDEVFDKLWLQYEQYSLALRWKVKCYKCQGSKKIVVDYDNEEYKTCNVCGGTGYSGEPDFEPRG